MPQKKLNSFIRMRQKKVTKYRQDSAREKFLKYALNNRKNVDNLAEELITSEFSQTAITLGTKSFISSIIKHFIDQFNEDADPKIKTISKQKLYQIALGKNLPFKPHEKGKISYEGIWFRSSFPIDNRGKDKLTQIKHCLKWMDCFCEFYFGESLFDRDTSQTNPPQQISRENLNDSESKLDLQPEEEKLILELLKRGYLQCDIDK